MHAMQFSELTPATTNGQALATAWARWRGDKVLPCRSDVQLDDISEILPWITLIEIFSETEIIFRLAGTMIREIMGFELTGHNLMELTEPDHRLARGIRTAQTAHQPCGAIWIWNVTFRNEKSRRMENMGLPVRPEEDGRPMQILNVCGMLDTAGPPQAINYLQQLASADNHSFIDIGAGVPTEVSRA
jgi:hypothetical protein